jgi:hypothetical protein
MNRIWMMLAISAGIALSATATAAAGWKLLGSQGDRYFVAVDAAQASNAALLKEAAAAACKPGKACVVLFWSDESAAATKMPMTAAQSKAVVAQFSRNPKSGQEDLLLKCKGTEPANSRCLK